MLYIGLLIGVVAGNVASHKAGIDPLRTYVATMVLIVAALAGGRLLFVITHWNSYAGWRRALLGRKSGGASMYGGLVLALAVSVPLLRLLRLRFGAFWDGATFTMLTGMIFVRVGCLLNGCCQGKPSEGKLTLLLPDVNGVWEPRVPTQIYEAGLGVLLLAGAIAGWRWMTFPGELFLLVLAAYSAARFAIEFGRQQEQGQHRLREGHAMSAILFISSFCALTFRWLK